MAAKLRQLFLILQATFIMPRFTIDPDIAQAKTLHKDFYTDPALFAMAKENLFAPSWQFVAGTEAAPEPGDACPLTLLEGFLDEPLALVRDKDGALRLLCNVCTHRGNLIVNEPCRLTHLRCRYHGRLFDLDGSFRSMPEFREVKDFPGKADNLTNLPLEKWGPWLFTSLAGNVTSSGPAAFADYWGDLIQRLHWLRLDEFTHRPDLSRDFIVKAHWALYCENYLEGFHIPFVHAGLNTVIDFGNYTTELFGLSSLQLGIAKDDEAIFDLPATSPDYGKKVAAYYFFVFPNIMFNFYPWGLSINIVKPVSLDETKVSFLTYVADASQYEKGAGSGLDTVELEDEEVVEAVQKGIRSRFYAHGRYSVTREQGTHHFHRLIAQQIG
jgi:choline monooxygenase